jgi:endonuclease VIII
VPGGAGPAAPAPVAPYAARMPEGDTIHRTAATLRRALVGRDLTRVDLPRHPPPLPSIGARVERIEARGKHLLVSTSDGLVVHTHQRMSGSWHLYRPGDRWGRSPRAARVVLGVPGVLAVCFSAPVVEVLDRRALGRHPVLRRLGPDLCEPDPDLDEVQRRLRGQDPARPIGEVLLDQRVASGIGNVYRGDVLFLHGLHPWTPLRDVDDGTRWSLFAVAGDLLRRNLETTSRTTVAAAPAGALWVYGRAGHPCRRCGTTIERGRLGEQARVVDWCPTCQPAAEGGRTAADAE